MKLKSILLSSLIILIKINYPATLEKTNKFTKKPLEKCQIFSSFLKKNILKGYKNCSTSTSPDCLEDHILDQYYCEKCYAKAPFVKDAFFEDCGSYKPYLEIFNKYKLDKPRFITKKIFPLFLLIANQIKPSNKENILFVKKYVLDVFDPEAINNAKKIIEILNNNKDKIVIIPTGTETHTAILLFNGIAKTIHIIEPATLDEKGESKYLHVDYMKKELSKIVDKESIFFYPISLMRNNSYTCTLMSGIIGFILYLSEGNIDALNTFLYLYNQGEIKTFEDFFNPNNLDFILYNQDKKYMDKDAKKAINSKHSEEFELSLSKGTFFSYALLENENLNNKISLSIKDLTLEKKPYEEFKAIDAFIIFLEISSKKKSKKKSLLDDDDDNKLTKPTIHNYESVIKEYNELSEYHKHQHRELIKDTYLLKWFCENFKNETAEIKKSKSSQISEDIIQSIKHKLIDLFIIEQNYFLNEMYNFFEENKNIFNFELKNPEPIKHSFYSWPCYY